MMTAVMVDARKPGLSGWTQLRHHRRVRVTGVREGLVILHLAHADGTDQVHTREDTIIKIPEHILRIKAELKLLGENTRVFIDLIGD